MRLQRITERERERQWRRQRESESGRPSKAYGKFHQIMSLVEGLAGLPGCTFARGALQNKTKKNHHFDSRLDTTNEQKKRCYSRTAAPVSPVLTYNYTPADCECPGLLSVWVCVCVCVCVCVSVCVAPALLCVLTTQLLMLHNNWDCNKKQQHKTVSLTVTKKWPVRWGGGGGERGGDGGVGGWGLPEWPRTTRL